MTILVIVLVCVLVAVVAGWVIDGATLRMEARELGEERDALRWKADCLEINESILRDDKERSRKYVGELESLLVTAEETVAKQEKELSFQKDELSVIRHANQNFSREYDKSLEEKAALKRDLDALQVQWIAQRDCIDIMRAILPKGKLPAKPAPKAKKPARKRP